MPDHQLPTGLRTDAARCCNVLPDRTDYPRAICRTAFRVAALVITTTAFLAGCREAPSDLPADTEPLTATHGNGVVVSPAQQHALELVTRQVTLRQLRDTLPATGWLVAEPGREVVVKAPLTGVIAPPDAASKVALGQTVTERQTLARLQVFLSPQEEAQLVAAKEDTDTVIRQSLASLQIARAQLDRLERESASAVRGTRLQELQESIARSQAAHDEAVEKLRFLPTEPYGTPLQLRDLPITTPIAGHIMRVEVNPGQLVLRGDPLWTIADWSKLWVRVPVFVADLPRLARKQNVQVLIPGTHTPLAAAPIECPQPSSPGRQTVDLFYEIDNARAGLRPGQAVVVPLPLGATARRPVLPQSAILWGDDGSASVYVRIAPDQFRRRKVVVTPLADDQVVIREGLAASDVVVTTGAEALYGEEFRWQIPQEDDDEEGD